MNLTPPAPRLTASYAPGPPPSKGGGGTAPHPPAPGRDHVGARFIAPWPQSRGTGGRDNGGLDESSPYTARKTRGPGGEANGGILAELPLILLALLFILPVAWGFLASLKPADELLLKPWALPTRLAWQNYVDAWNGKVALYLLNSTIITVVAVSLIIALAAPAAYSFARLRFRGHALAFMFLLGGLLIPVHAVLIPLYQFNEAIWPKGWALREWLSIVGPYVAFGLPLTVLLLRAYFVSIPKELADAAAIDGASHWRALWSIFLPVARPAVATVAIFQAAWIWNELPFAMVFIKTPALRTLPVGLLSFQGEHSSEWQIVLAGVCMAIVPMLILYFVFQRHIIKGLTAGAVK